MKTLLSNELLKLSNKGVKVYLRRGVADSVPIDRVAPFGIRSFKVNEEFALHDGTKFLEVSLLPVSQTVNYFVWIL
jgi:hypothetical protein